jgi:hypothetical protein
VYSNRWSPRLRQGDVVGPLNYPKLKKAPREVVTSGWGGAQPETTLETPASSKYAVVVSHDCEFNDTKRVQLLLARLDDFSQSTDEETKAAIKSANDAIRIREDHDDDEVGYDYIDTFVLDALPGRFDHDQLIRFTTITSWPMAMKDPIRELKQAELEHDHRVRLRNKLGFFFGRGGDDMPDEEKSDAPVFEAS